MNHTVVGSGKQKFLMLLVAAVGVADNCDAAVQNVAQIAFAADDLALGI